METIADSKGRIAIPAALCKKYGIEHGTRIVILDDGRSVVLRPMTDARLRMLQGSLKGKGGLSSLLIDRRIDRR